MRPQVMNQLKNSYPNLQKLPDEVQVRKELQSGEWFLFETIPSTRSVQEAKMIVADLIRNKVVYVLPDGTLEHDKECTNNHDLDDVISRAVENLDYKPFKILLWENPTIIFNRQPLFISLEPEISLSVYPDHPHINYSYSYLQDSLCYTDRPEELGKEPFLRISRAIDIVNVWLFKHILWLETKKLGKAIWIGGAVDIEFKEQFDYYRNPDGLCRCGKNLKYSECHLSQDFRTRFNIGPIFAKPTSEKIPFLDSDLKFSLDLYREEWKSIFESKKAFLKEMQTSKKEYKI